MPSGGHRRPPPSHPNRLHRMATGRRLPRKSTGAPCSPRPAKYPATGCQMQPAPTQARRSRRQDVWNGAASSARRADRLPRQSVGAALDRGHPQPVLISIPRLDAAADRTRAVVRDERAFGSVALVLGNVHAGVGEVVRLITSVVQLDPAALPRGPRWWRTRETGPRGSRSARARRRTSPDHRSSRSARR